MADAEAPAEHEGALGMKAEEEATEDQARRQASSAAVATHSKHSSDSAPGDRTTPNPKDQEGKGVQATGSSGLPEQVGAEDLKTAWEVMTKQGAPVASPYLREVAGMIREAKWPCPAWKPAEVSGPVVEVRNSAATEMPVLSSDLSRQLLRRDLRLGQVPTEAQVSLLWVNLTVGVGGAGVGTNFQALAGTAKALSTLARDLEQIGQLLLVPIEVLALRVIAGVGLLPWTSGPSSFVERFPAADLCWWRTPRPPGPGQNFPEGVPQPIPPGLFNELPPGSTAQRVLLAYIILLSFAGEVQFDFVAENPFPGRTRQSKSVETGPPSQSAPSHPSAPLAGVTGSSWPASSRRQVRCLGRDPLNTSLLRSTSSPTRVAGS